ncbi:hypothetical protein [Streptomyces sp. B1I3]|uniref:hypothetical protein n=1 Tax=Streptomyces sp. B1I3 TaxID=3042264 RepID=UPI002780FF65|nr:hypothetical protein [Streptomyces sp. B1I3]MDQ0795575.1 hypothetical protein [Streptomyces sp. B1I3]
MATSAVPAAIDALLEILREDAELYAVRIFDGPTPTTNFTEQDRLYIGWSPASDQSAEMQQSFASAGGRTRDEDATIACYIETRAGNTDMRERRLQVFALFALVETALRSTDQDPNAMNLNGAVQWSDITAGSLDQVQSDNGSMAGLSFTVHFRARI